jgi:hypothetical protein
MEDHLTLKHFDLNWITNDSICVAIGKRRSGKSVLIEDILHHKRDIPIGMAISPTEELNKCYSNFMPSIFIYNKYDEAIIANIIKRQTIMVKRLRKDRTIDERSFLILDDCLYDDKWARDRYMRYLFMNGRHLKLFVMITMQYPLGVPPTLRTNIDFVFLHRENIVSNRKRLYQNYAGMFPTFEMFCGVLDQCTENFGILVIMNCSRSNKLEDTVFWYRAEMHEPFKMMDESLWVKAAEQEMEQRKARNILSDVEDVCLENDTNKAAGASKVRKIVVHRQI